MPKHSYREMYYRKSHIRIYLRQAPRPSPPVLISKHEPKYSPEALKSRLQGTVLVSLVVGTDGVPQNVKVLRGLGLGLDEKAVEAVQR